MKRFLTIITVITAITEFASSGAEPVIAPARTDMSGPACVSAFGSVFSDGFFSDGELRLLYDRPAKAWEEALPLGNGHLGAMDFGRPASELFSLNEKTLWSGFPYDGLNERCRDAIPLIREKIDNREYKEASELWINNCQGPYTARYLPMADLRIDMVSPDDVTLISRELNISKAVSSVDFRIRERKCSRKAFISYPDRVMVIRYESDAEGTFDFDVSMTSLLKYTTECPEDRRLVLQGQAPSYIPFFERDTCLIRYEEEHGKGLKFRVDVDIRTV